MELDQKEFGTLTEKLESYASQVSKLQTTIQMQNEIKEVQAENERERLENMRLVLLPRDWCCYPNWLKRRITNWLGWVCLLAMDIVLRLSRSIISDRQRTIAVRFVSIRIWLVLVLFFCP